MYELGVFFFIISLGALFKLEFSKLKTNFLNVNLDFIFNLKIKIILNIFCLN